MSVSVWLCVCLCVVCVGVCACGVCIVGCCCVVVEFAYSRQYYFQVILLCTYDIHMISYDMISTEQNHLKIKTNGCRQNQQHSVISYDTDRHRITADVEDLSMSRRGSRSAAAGSGSSPVVPAGGGAAGGGAASTPDKRAVTDTQSYADRWCPFQPKLFALLHPCRL